MITPIISIKPYNCSFQGKNWKKAANLCFDSFQSSNDLKFYKKVFNYAPDLSEQVNVYKGPKFLKAGFSTENLEDVGGGYLIESCLKPLSTTGVRTCAVLNLVNEKQGQNVLYHVWDKTCAERIEEFIRKKFPIFNKVNIVGGDQYKTANTMKKIIQAVDNVNPNADKFFYYTVSDNPELIAYGGDMYYMKGSKGSVSFVQKDSYWY